MFKQKDRRNGRGLMSCGLNLRAGTGFLEKKSVFSCDSDVGVSGVGVSGVRVSGVGVWSVEDLTID